MVDSVNMELPERRPPDAQVESTPQAQPVVSPNDSRHEDPGMKIFLNILMQGTLPWAQAAYDLATGRITEEQFDQTRQEHQQYLDTLSENHKEFVSAVQDALPFITGLGIGVAGKGGKVATDVARGTGAAGAQGFAQGFSSGPTEEPSFSSNRVSEGVGNALVTAPLGAAGAAAPAAVSSGRKALRARGERKRAEAEQEAQAVKRQETAQKAKSTRDARKAETENNRIQATRFAQKSRRPTDPMPEWEKNQKIFLERPKAVFAEAASMGHSLNDISRYTNLSEVAVARKIAAAGVSANSKQSKKLIGEVYSILRAGDAAKAHRAASKAPSAPKSTATKTSPPEDNSPIDTGSTYRGPALDRRRKKLTGE